MDKEIWRPIPGMYGFDASSLGRVRNRKKVLPQCYQTDGYLWTTIYGKKYQVHRLICGAFYGHKSLMYVNHKDRIKDNNIYTNLEWISCKNNAIHAINTKVGEGNMTIYNSISVYGTKRGDKSTTGLSNDERI